MNTIVSRLFDEFPRLKKQLKERYDINLLDDSVNNIEFNVVYKIVELFLMHNKISIIIKEYSYLILTKKDVYKRAYSDYVYRLERLPNTQVKEKLKKVALFHALNLLYNKNTFVTKIFY